MQFRTWGAHIEIRDPDMGLLLQIISSEYTNNKSKVNVIHKIKFLITNATRRKIASEYKNLAKFLNFFLNRCPY